MNEPGFTPGPWEVSSFRCSYVGVESTVASGCQGGNQSVTRCVVTTNSLPRAQAEANARLIAAAPELYGTGEFLAARLREFEEFVGEGEAARQWFGHVLPALARFEMVQEKARGHHA